MSADPYIQSPTDTQSLNRYAYVLNNPLSATDPSGYFFKKFAKKWLKPIVAAVAAYYTFGYASAWALNAYGASCAVACSLATASIVQGVAGGVAAGFVGGAINSGTLKGATKGAFSGAISAGINSFGLNDFADVANIARNVNAILAGTSTGKTGGKFGNGAPSESFAQASNGEGQKQWSERKGIRESLKCKGRCHGISGLGNKTYFLDSDQEMGAALVVGFVITLPLTRGASVSILEGQLLQASINLQRAINTGFIVTRAAAARTYAATSGTYLATETAIVTSPVFTNPTILQNTVDGIEGLLPGAASTPAGLLVNQSWNGIEDLYEKLSKLLEEE